MAIADVGRVLTGVPIEQRPGPHGLWSVRRVYLGRVEHLAPSGRYWGPCTLDVGWANTFPFHFDAARDCPTCIAAWTEAWRAGDTSGEPCRADRPCELLSSRPGYAHTHCDICRDAVWYDTVQAEFDRWDSMLLLMNGEDDHRQLFAVQWLQLEQPDPAA